MLVSVNIFVSLLLHARRTNGQETRHSCIPVMNGRIYIRRRLTPLEKHARRLGETTTELVFLFVNMQRVYYRGFFCRPNVAARILKGSFLRSLIGRGLCGGPQIGIMKIYIWKTNVAAVLVRFGPWLGSRLVVGVGLGLRPFLDPTRKCLLARKREQPTAPKIRANRLLGKLFSRVKIRPAGRVRTCWKSHGSGWVGSGGVLTSRVGSGRVTLTRPDP